jgi:hypothetical protein
MMPVLVLAGIVVLVSIALFGLYALGYKGQGSRRLHMRITLVPPSLDFDIEQRSD